MNNKLFNQKNYTVLRKKLRNNPTTPESLLWSRLRGSQLNGYKFRRQQGIGKYIADFYCPQLKLVIELDGNSHYVDDEQKKDEGRDRDFHSLGLTVLRFTNEEVVDNTGGVIEVISRKITTLNPSFKRREGK